MQPTLGTLLRHLLELLDGAVERAYDELRLRYKPRFTPVVRALVSLGPAPLASIASHAGISHSAVSQTVAQMEPAGLVAVRLGVDARERIVSLTPDAERLLPALRAQWAATEAAARSLDADLSVPLSAVLEQAIRHLEKRSFDERMRDAGSSRLQARPRRSA